MNNSTDDRLCDLAHQIHSTHYRGVIAAEIATSVLAILPNSLLLSAVWNVTIFPSNLRLLLGHLSFVLIYFSIASILKGIYRLITPVCTFTISVQCCKIIETVGANIALPNMYYSVMALSIERIYATICYKKYDKKQKPWMAMILICLSWLVSFYVNSGFTIWQLPNGVYVPFCDQIFIPSGGSYNIALTYVFIEIAVVSITLSVHYYNKYIARNMAINRAVYDLSSRFLVNQNVEISRILLPGVALHCCCHLPTFISLASIQWIDTDPSIKTLLTRSTFLCRLIYALFDPLIAIGYNKHLRQHLLNGRIGKMLKKLGAKYGKKNAVGALFNAADHHFDQLNKVWDVAAEKMLSKKQRAKSRNGGRK